MILIVDTDNVRSRVGAVVDGVVTWSECGPRETLVCIGKASVDAVPSGIAVVMGEDGRDISWSAIRGTVAVANAFAFGKGIPAVGIPFVADAADTDIVAAANAALADAAPDARVAAMYSAEPNITKPKDAA